MFFKIDETEYWKSPGPYGELADRSSIRTSYFVLGDSASDNDPVAAVLDLAPGQVVGRHAHPTHRFEVVVRGSMEANGRTLVAGDVMIADPGEFYGPNMAGPDGCTTVEVFADAIGAHTVLFDMRDGSVRSVDGFNERMHAPEGAIVGPCGP